MAKGLVNIESLNAIANAIREKLGTTATYKPAEMAPAILSIPTGGTGEEVPKVYVPKNLEHQDIVITPAQLAAPTETGDKLIYPALVSAVNIKLVPITGYTPGKVIINGNVMGSEVTDYRINEGDNIGATAATKVAESPKFNQSGTVTLVQAPDEMNIFGADHVLTAYPSEGLGAIANTATQYPVISVITITKANKSFVKISMRDLYEFWGKFSSPFSVVFTVTIGSISMSMCRDELNSISGGIAPSQFNYLMETVGTPLDFSIKYE